MYEERCAILLQSVDVVRGIQENLGKISRRKDDRRRHDLVAARRMLATEVASVADIAGPLFEDVGDPPLLADYRRLFSAVRSKSAAHQATWSAVRVGEDEADYMRSALEAADAHTQLIRWLKGAIAQILNR